MRRYRMLLNVSYKGHVTNEGVRRKIQANIFKHDDLDLGQKTETEVVCHISRSSGLA